MDAKELQAKIDNNRDLIDRTLNSELDIDIMTDIIKRLSVENEKLIERLKEVPINGHDMGEAENAVIKLAKAIGVESKVVVQILEDGIIGRRFGPGSGEAAVYLINELNATFDNY